ncbi:MAG: hypothetical protein WCZ27_04325 [Tissierellaceae bacterium]
MGNEDRIQEILERVVRIEIKIEGYNSLKERLDKIYGITLGNKKYIQEIKDSQKWPLLGCSMCLGP